MGATNAGPPLALPIQRSGFTGNTCLCNFYLARLTWNIWHSLGWTPSLTTITATASDFNHSGRRHFHLSYFFRSRLAVVHRNGCGPLPEFCGNPQIPTQVQLLPISQLRASIAYIGLDRRLPGHCRGLGHAPRTKWNLPSRKAATATCKSRQH